MTDEFSDFEVLMEDPSLEDLENDLEAYAELDEDGELASSELLEFRGESDFETKADASSFALMRAIPDSADYRRFIPHNYRLNAKAIVGKLAQDLEQLKTPSINELRKSFVDIAKFAIGSTVGAPIKILIDALKNIPGGYMAAAAKIASEWANSGFSRGVVMGADGRTRSYMLAVFGRRDVDRHNFGNFPYGFRVAVANYSAGLLAGYVQGRSLSKPQRAIFWRDLGHRMGNQSHRAPKEQWTRKQWEDWYISVAAAFRRFHL